MAPATYSIDLYSLCSASSSPGTRTVQGLDVTSFSCSWVMNGPGAFEATGVLGTVQDDIKNVGQRQIIVRRDGNAVWGGYLSRFDVDRDARTVRIIGEGYWSAMRRRLMRGANEFRGTWYFSSNTSGTIDQSKSVAWAIIKESQALPGGELGWVAGTHIGSDGVAFERVYRIADRDNIGGLIERLADQGKGDFAVTVKASPAQATGFATFDTWAVRGTDRNATHIFDGTNTMTLNYARTALDLYTVIDAFGNDPCAPNEITLPSASSISSDPSVVAYGRREAQPLDLDTNATAELTEAATEYLAAHKFPAFVAELSYLEESAYALTTYDVGDTVKFKPQDGLYPGTSVDARVVERELSVEANVPVINLTLEQRPT